MAKRGERRPWKVTYRWENGVGGTDARSSEDEAQMIAARIRRAAEARGMRVEISVYYRASE
jgi:hypothetical protein